MFCYFLVIEISVIYKIAAIYDIYKNTTIFYLALFKINYFSLDSLLVTVLNLCLATSINLIKMLVITFQK